MIHYPVVIPTLNRADHLKRCLLSLMKNTGADDTEVYISVDFPPAEKYVQGYNKVKELLASLDLSGFKKVNIVYQEENLGAVKNSDFLFSLVKDEYDAYIFSEDDNEFAPNFLEYMNKGLEIFRDDSRVVAVCGSKDTDWETDGKNYAAVKLFAAYGVGTWIQEKLRREAEGSAVIVPERPYGFKKIQRLYKQNKGLFCLYALAIMSTDTGLFWRTSDTLYWCDTMYSLYMHFTDKFSIAPQISKARTWGNDGSGTNMPKTDIDVEKETPLDNADTFEYDTVGGLRFNDKNYKLASEYLSVSKITVLKAIIVYAIVFLFGKNRKGAIKFLKTPRKIWERLKK